MIERELQLLGFLHDRAENVHEFLRFLDEHNALNLDVVDGFQ